MGRCQPDGDYSAASEPLIYPDPGGPPRTDCQPEFLVEFHTLETGDLPGSDNIPNNWANMMEPVTGSFFANGEEVIFQGATLYPGSSYDLNDLVAANPGGMSRLVIEPRPGENVRVGFDLGTYEGWDGFNDFCTTGLYHDYSFSELMGYGYFEDTLVSYEDDGARCRVHYTIRPLEGSPFGTDNPNFLPLPWLDVVGLRQEPGTGWVQVKLKNTGSAEWANQRLRLEFVDREQTEHYGAYGESEFFLGVGESKWITAMEAPSQGDITRTCVIVDPDSLVLELYENTGALLHENMRYCLPAPDLRLSEVEFDFMTNTLRMHVWNTGQNDNDLGSNVFDLANLTAWIVMEDGGALLPTAEGQFAGETLYRGDDVWLEWPLAQTQRDLMTSGYEVILDPEDKIYETDEDNNSIEVREGRTLRVVWKGMDLRWYPNYFQECPNYGRWASHDSDVWVSMYTRSEYQTQMVAEWHWSGVVRDEDLFVEDWGGSWDPSNYFATFFVEGEEDLVVEVNGEQHGDPMGSATAVFEPERDWSSMELITPSGGCNLRDRGTFGYPITAYPSRTHWRVCGPWYVYINICMLTE